MAGVARRSRRRTAALLLGLAAALGIGAVAIPAAADEAVKPESVVIRSVDATAYPDVEATILVDGADPAPGDFGVAVEGVPIDDLSITRLSDEARPTGTVLVVDVSEVMAGTGAFSEVRAALASFVEQLAPGEEVAIVSYGVNSRIVVHFTSDPALLRRAVEGLEVWRDREEAVLRDAVRSALVLLRQRPDLQPNVVIVGASGEEVSNVGHAVVAGSVVETKALVRGIGVRVPGLDGGGIERLARASGGRYVETDAAELGAALTEWRDTLQAQRLVRFQAPPAGKAVDLDLRVGDVTRSVLFQTGAVVSGRNLTPDRHEPSITKGPAFLQTETGKLTGGLLALGACVLLAYGVILLVVRDRSTLDTVLRPYDEMYKPEVEDEVSGGGFAETRFVQRAVALTEDFARRQGLLPRVEHALEQADLPLRPAEALFFYAAGVVITALLALVLSGSLLVGLVAAVFVGLIPPAIVAQLGARRRAKFMAQLPDTLQLLSGSLRAGYSFMQGVEAVAHEMADPMGRELRRVIVESRLGRPIETAMEEAAERMGSADFAWAVMAVKIQREVGGNLAELLMTVSETMVQRDRLRRDVKALTAEGRVSALVLGILPGAIGAAMWAVNPDYIETLFNERLGNYMLVGSLALAIVGFVWMKKTVEIEV